MIIINIKYNVKEIFNIFLDEDELKTIINKKLLNIILLMENYSSWNDNFYE